MQKQPVKNIQRHRAESQRQRVLCQWRQNRRQEEGQGQCHVDCKENRQVPTLGQVYNEKTHETQETGEIDYAFEQIAVDSW